MKNTTKDNRTFVDANILIEILESRPKQKLALQTIRGLPGDLCISLLTCHIVCYVSQKRLGLDLIEHFLRDYEWLDLVPEDMVWAIKNRQNSDIEDALQVAIAVRNGCSEFITFDRGLAEAYGNLEALEIRLLS